MNHPKTNSTWFLSILLGILLAFSFNASAAFSSCARMDTGTGMGGTGIVAKSTGTGMGGTGGPAVKPDDDLLAGNVIYSKGEAQAQRPGHSRALAIGDPVCVGDTIETSTGSLRIMMVDNGFISVRPQTRLKIEQFAYSKSNKDSSIIKLISGSGRFITGMIGKLQPKNDVIQTEHGIIGVRGTDHEATVIQPGNINGYQPGTYDRVNQGITFIRTDVGEVNILPNQVGLSVDIGEIPTILSEIPDFYDNLPSFQEEGMNPAKDWGHEEWGGEHDGAEHADRSAGDHSIEIETSSDAHESKHDVELPEAHRFEDGMEHPELPESHESPELPELPELPEAFELPESPDH